MNNIIKELLEKAKDCQNKNENLKAEKFYKRIIDIDSINFKLTTYLGYFTANMKNSMKV